MPRRKKISDKTRREMIRGAEVVQHNNIDQARATRDGNPKFNVWRDRERYMMQLLLAGRIRLLPELGQNGLPLLTPRHVTIQVGLCTFSDTLRVYPSEKMVANVALAIDAGMEQRLPWGREEDDPNNDEGA